MFEVLREGTRLMGLWSIMPIGGSSCAEGCLRFIMSWGVMLNSLLARTSAALFIFNELRISTFRMANCIFCFWLLKDFCSGIGSSCKGASGNTMSLSSNSSAGVQSATLKAFTGRF